VTAVGQLTCSAFVAMLASFIVDRPWSYFPLSGTTIWSIIGLATLCTALAYVIYFRVLATAGATNLLLVTFLIPVSALLLGMTFLGERLDPRQFAGMALIGAGLIAIDGRLLSLLRHHIINASKDTPAHRKANS
jgi:drug/metabolite transporter (DMT)-like permease